MTTNITELVFILDRSGSMAGLEADTIGGFNAMLKKQQAQPGQARVTTLLFDNAHEFIHDRLDLAAVSPLNPDSYFVRGSTALLDAMGKSIQKVDRVMAATDPEHRPHQVLFVIITDGMENASRRFTREQVVQLVHSRRQMGWEFIFLGANMDAIQVAEGYGFSPDRAQTYMNDPQGVGMNFDAVSRLASEVRASRPIPQDWDRDIKERGSRKKRSS
ncbi:MAG: VWA domain-containing protein [Clostridiales bacterium]|nr:VWA domain-containing protein [Clostridiales bacterium]